MTKILAGGYIMQPMSTYEKLALIMSGVAILIPIVQWIWKKYIQKPRLNFLPTGRAFLFCNRSGSYIRIEGVYEAQKKPITVKNISVIVRRKKDDNQLRLQWSVFISPVNQSLIGNYMLSTETAHPFRIEADSIVSAFTEFSDPFDSAGKTLQPIFEKNQSIIAELRKENADYQTALIKFVETPEYAEAKSSMEKQLFWEIGQYAVTIEVQYGKKTERFAYEFEVNQAENDKMLSNIKESIISDLKSAYNIPLSMQTILVEIKEKRIS